jgi:hypothetical protein
MNPQKEKGLPLGKPLSINTMAWLRGSDLNRRPPGYEPDELPGCSTPRLRYYATCRTSARLAQSRSAFSKFCALSTDFTALWFRTQAGVLPLPLPRQLV